MRRLLLVLVTMIALPGLALAQAVKTYGFDGSFEDAAFGVESAIVDRGLVVDHVSHVSHVGDMLNRTRIDVGGARPGRHGAGLRVTVNDHQEE